ncbi:MAG TPA: LamG-like jellyroll fold domain-containing protein [Polyangiaceae bacterium]|nr:LamG-like jellyroll fold domain-containing protein [Polyangiaceae bacterium]
MLRPFTRSIYAVVSTLLAASVGFAACAEEGSEFAKEAPPENVDVARQQIFFDADLGSAMGNVVASGSTCSSGNEFAPVCASSNAGDLAYYWTAPSSGTFTFTTTGSGFDTVLQALDAGQTQSLGCNDDANGTLQSSLSLALSAGQKITIIVDGYSSSCGSFALNISPSVPTSGLGLWLAADGLALANGAKVSTWPDKSGNGRNGVMATLSRQPTFVTNALNGRPVVRFGGAQSLGLSTPVQPTTFSVFVVGKNSMPSETFSMILGPGGNWPNNQLRWENGSQALFVGTSNGMPAVTSSIGNTRAYHVLSATYTGSTLSVYRNGGLVSNHSFSTNGPWTLAQVGAWYSTYFMQGDLAEVMVYDRSLPSSERSAVESYLRSKYAL